MGDIKNHNMKLVMSLWEVNEKTTPIKDFIELSDDKILKRLFKDFEESMIQLRSVIYDIGKESSNGEF